MNPAAFMPRDESGQFTKTHDKGTPCCGAEFQNMTMLSGSVRQSCTECGNWDIVG